ncbi:hypothetical protein M409DRAFT_26409 [Zasmidium cellare ATCC 36951]|uniref:F-box domain-containing protein n=1 Tax=Zasmidium cellare ATCC 36951 TaxID=1080233 RepID=A0A6A6CBT0_ZASCE|nr:uncharacterized protein M409DRAFT_26409 [Zasmidium cellare ATCC 36951]KAF2163372.1 hypothetical protein M409DRAFT_26409 [Zasmidium cellare ATCC 36951]
MEPSSPSESSPLLRLPAELRLQIYQHALHPTSTLTLTSTKTTRYAVLPRISPALLSTCPQIHAEAQSLLLTENTLALTLDAHETYWPPISESRLPQSVLEKIQHLCVVFDCTVSLNARYEDVDFGAFEALISLKTLRVAVIHVTEDVWGGPGRDPVERCVELLTEVLMRVPRSAKVFCGIEEGTQEGVLLEEKLVAKRQGRQRPEVMQVVEKKDTEAAVMKVPGELRGTKNGGNPDVFAQYREQQMGEARRFAMS